MSQGKFASITSSLLARKGEAAPWTENARTPLAWRTDVPPVAVPLPPAPPPPAPLMRRADPPAPDALKRCTVRLTQADYERLGLMAVKKSVTRQQLLQAALAEGMAGLARGFSRDCACIGAGIATGACCTHA